MKTADPQKESVDKLADLFSRIQNIKGPMITGKPIMELLKWLEDEVKLITALTDEFSTDKKELNENEKKSLEQLKSMEKDMKSYKRQVDLSLKKSMDSTPKTESEKKKLQQKRKRKFKSVGSDKGWIPL